MAIQQIDQLAPALSQRSRVREFADQTLAALKLVPDLTVDNSQTVSNRAFIGFLIGVFTAGLLLLLSRVSLSALSRGPSHGRFALAARSVEHTTPAYSA